MMTKEAQRREQRKLAQLKKQLTDDDAAQLQRQRQAERKAEEGGRAPCGGAARLHQADRRRGAASASTRGPPKLQTLALARRRDSAAAAAAASPRACPASAAGVTPTQVAPGVGLDALARGPAQQPRDVAPAERDDERARARHDALHGAPEPLVVPRADPATRVPGDSPVARFAVERGTRRVPAAGAARAARRL